MEIKLANIAEKMIAAAANVQELNGKTYEAIRDRNSVYLTVIDADGTENGVVRVSHWSSYGDKDTWEIDWPNAVIGALINVWDGTVEHLEQTIRKGLRGSETTGLAGRRRR